MVFSVSNYMSSIYFKIIFYNNILRDKFKIILKNYTYLIVKFKKVYLFFKILYLVKIKISKLK